VASDDVVGERRFVHRQRRVAHVRRNAEPRAGDSESNRSYNAKTFRNGVDSPVLADRAA